MSRCADRAMPTLVVAVAAACLAYWYLIGPRPWLRTSIRVLVGLGVVVGIVLVVAMFVRPVTRRAIVAFGAVGVAVVLLLGPATKLSVDLIVVRNLTGDEIDRIELIGPGFEHRSGPLADGESVDVFVTPNNEGAVRVIAKIGGGVVEQEIFLLELIDEVVHVDFE